MGEYERKYYQMGHLWFPSGEKTYLQTCCCEWDNLDAITRVSHLGYMVTHGFDLVAAVEKYAAERPNDKSYIVSAFLSHIGYMRTGDDLPEPLLYELEDEGKITLTQLVKLFCKEVKLRFDVKGAVSCRRENGKIVNEYELQETLKEMHWDYYALFDKLGKDRSKVLETVTQPTTEYLKIMEKNDKGTKATNR